LNKNNKKKGIRSYKYGPLTGEAEIPGDKSISHRSLILGALCVGKTTIQGLLEGEDVLCTAEAIRNFGSTVIRHSNGYWTVDGVGVGGFSEPNKVVDCGNSGTAARLILGAMATSPITATFSGDESLIKRPMERVINPLRLFGAQFFGKSGARFPMTAIGAKESIPVEYTMPIPSAQVKSAILLAGLNAPGKTTIFESQLTRDHTERMLESFGAHISVEYKKKGKIITLEGYPELKSQSVIIPRDPSSAAFPICAALIVEGSDISVPNITLNPSRSGLFQTLNEMGADIEYSNKRIQSGEPIADLRVKYSRLKGVNIPSSRAASMIDEYPILSVVASFAEGKTVMRGVGELRVKESDRIHAMAQGLSACGIKTEQSEETFVVHGNGDNGVNGGVNCSTFLDHRIAMSFLCLGLASKKAVSVDDYSTIATSFPNFKGLMEDLGAKFEID
jgi:3-phosphoshikimate 1-carboxyvinyltransferase